MKRILLLFFFVALIVVVGASWFAVSIAPLNNVKSSKRFLIQKGETASQIGQNLQKEGLIKSAVSFRIYTQLTGYAKQIKPGEYELSSNLSVPSMVTTIISGPTQVWVTIPEGLRREEIADRFVKEFGLGSVNAQKFRDEFLEGSKDKEGYLFPDTYLFPKDATATVVIKKMRATFDQVVDFPVSYNQVILASILERETITDTERSIVAGVLLKRVNAGWAINADATIQYAIGTINCKDQSSDCNWWKPVLQDDLKISSPFNSYTNPGLPPSPIANPGLSSIKASVNPQESDYWYYIHDKDGVIHYAKTLEEQNANINKYLY